MRSSTSQPRPSFERVYREHFDFVVCSLRALGVHESALDDGVQDAFIVVHRRLPEFEGRASVRTWLYEVARRVALRSRGRAARDAARHAELSAALAGDQDLEGAIDEARASEILQRFIAELDEDRRRAFVLAEFGEMSGREIAESLGVNVNTVYARIRSARLELERLARRLQAQDAGALTRAVQRRRGPSRVSVRAAIVASLGASPSAAVGTGMFGALAVGVAAVGLVAATPVADWVRPDPPPATKPKPTVTSPRLAAAAPSPPVAAPTAPTPPPPEVSAPPPPDPPRAKRKAVMRAAPKPPSVTDDLATVEAIRAAVARADVPDATARIRRYFAGPTGALATEVRALEVELACRTGADGAGATFEAFARANAGSTLLGRLRALCREQIGPRDQPEPGTQPR
ncbi:MAG: sigma-70 family RNA polymerase sigma factor [Myxococcota bacterium]